MSDLRKKLEYLQEEYLDMPPAVQQADLKEINQLRLELGMPSVDPQLNEIGVTVDEVGNELPEETEPNVPEIVRDFTEAREIYQAYLRKMDELKPHQVYARQVSRATDGRGQTPVRPLATMGTNGGPLLCDWCKKPIVLEGGKFHGKNADAAWKRNPNDEWKSWILGGLVVEIQSNSTLRIYHGYPERNPNHCCNAASRADDEARAGFDSSLAREKRSMLQEWIEQKFPETTVEEQRKLTSNVLDTVFSYDPGIGINRPNQD